MERSWIIGVVLFVVVRFLIAYSALRHYGLTVWVFGILDLATAVPYALGTARLVTCMVDRNMQSAARWGMVASISFLAPYLWIAWAGRDGQFPVEVYVVVAVLVICLGANAVLGVHRRVKRDRVRPIGEPSALGVSSS